MILPFSGEEHTRPVMEIWLEASRTAHGFIPMAYWESTAPLVEKEILPQADTRVFVQDGRVEGFLSLIEGDHIGALFVAPRSQGRGIGSALLEDRKAEKDLLTLAVYKRNLRAVGFYRSRGFSILEERTEEGTGEREYLMAWRRKDG